MSDLNTSHVLKGSTISANLGAVSVCSSNCGATTTLTYAVTASGSLGHIKVLTQGSNSTSLDFSLAGGSNCPLSEMAGSTCTINVRFSPRYPGLRTGVLQITRADGTLAASTMLYGVGQGPQIAFDRGTSKNVASLSVARRRSRGLSRRSYSSLVPTNWWRSLRTQTAPSRYCTLGCRTGPRWRWMERVICSSPIWAVPRC